MMAKQGRAPLRDPRQEIRRRAFEAGVNGADEGGWWPELAPLTPAERDRVRSDVREVIALTRTPEQILEQVRAEHEPETQP